jgi:predicted nucleotidyltransferase
MSVVDLRIDEPALRAAGVRLVVVFGSAARGSGRPGSDLDVGVLFDGGTPGLDEPAEPFDRRREAVARALRADREIDLVVLDEADPLLLREVALDGRPVYEEEPGAFEGFRLRAIKRYLDTEWMRRAEAEHLRRRYG